MQRISYSFLSFCFLLLFAACRKDEVVKDPTEPTIKLAEKTNPARVYMHYMPWFHSKDFSGYWGIHWKMTNRNPEIILSNGQRQIASHYYPLIGPYDSGDPDLVDYHLLLMKYAGIDGILIDWYGSYDVLDYGTNLKNANAAIAGVKRTGLDFAVVYEDNTTEEVARRKNVTELEAAQADLRYAKAQYFSSPRYILLNDKPLFLTFGPRFFITPSQWTSILAEAGEPLSFFPLWGHLHRVGTTQAAGEFSWVDFTPPLTELNNFYNNTAPSVKIGSAYPGFHDYYKLGGWGDGYGFVDHDSGATMQKTLDLAKAQSLPYLQLVTWNDFGEGTMIEPTAEFQFQYLEMIQEFTGVHYSRSELELIYNYYLKRKEFSGDTEKQKKLDDIFNALNNLDVSTAESLLQSL